MHTNDDGFAGAGPGHNIGGATVTVEVRLFNTLYKYGGGNGAVKHIEFPAGSAIGDIIRELAIPLGKIHLALRNGRDVTASLYTDINTAAVLDDGDVIALSGPVPYSWGYGAPVV